jgi:hypothetical protein
MAGGNGSACADIGGFDRLNATRETRKGRPPSAAAVPVFEDRYAYFGRRMMAAAEVLLDAH